MDSFNKPENKLLDLKEYIKVKLMAYLDDKHGYEEFCSGVQSIFTYSIGQGFYITKLELNFYPFDLELEAAYLDKPDNWSCDNIMGLLINLYSALIGTNICLSGIIIEEGCDICLKYREHPDYRYGAYNLQKVPAEKTKWKIDGS